MWLHVPHSPLRNLESKYICQIDLLYVILYASIARSITNGTLIKTVRTNTITIRLSHTT